jgi:hypothetical protein
MCLFLLLSAGILSWLPKPPNPAEILVAHPAADIGSEVKLINDEELFRLFPGRSLALIGKPGEQKLIFLDEEADSTKPGL